MLRLDSRSTYPLPSPKAKEILGMRLALWLQGGVVRARRRL